MADDLFSGFTPLRDAREAAGDYDVPASWFWALLIPAGPGRWAPDPDGDVWEPPPERPPLLIDATPLGLRPARLRAAADWLGGEPWALLRGDCLDRLRRIEDASVDAVVTDPPYGLEFMGKDWDKFGGGRKGKPGIGDRETAWVSNQGWNAFRCRSCGHLSHGGSPCQCAKPDFGRADNRLVMFQIWCEQWAAECLRVLKPGGHLLAFGGTRTYHRLVCAIEDAGLEVRDSLHWIYGSGFLGSPKVWT